jgi:monoamine oxidase
VARGGLDVLDILGGEDDDYLTDPEREERNRQKRRELIRDGLTPDWFTGRPGFWCLPTGMSVAVIGGGFAGMAAAWYLNECGVDTTVYEAADRLGGRVRTDSIGSGKIAEAGAELIGENHPLWWELASRLGLTLEKLTDDSVYERAGLDVRLRFGGHDLTKPEKTALHADLMLHFATLGAEARPVPERAPWFARGARTLDGMTVADRLNTMLPPASSFTRTWFDFTLPNDNLAELDHQSYLGLLGAISAARMGSDPKGMLGYWFSTETHRCKGGNQQLADKIHAKLPDVRLSTVVTEVKVERGFFFDQVGITSVSGSSRRHEHFDYAIMTPAPTVWGAITFDPPFVPARRVIQHGPAVKFLTTYSAKFWENPAVMLAPSAKSDALGSVWEATDNQGPAAPFGLTVYSGGRFVLPAAGYPPGLTTLYPTRTSTLTSETFVDWPTTPFVMTGYGVPGVNQVTRIGRFQARPHADRVFFAGEQTHMGFFGYMEGALQSGTRAARDIVLTELRPCTLLDLILP